MNRLESATKLWELLEIALEDFKEMLKNPDFEPEMVTWLYINKSKKICTGCLAGAALYKEYELEGTAEFDYRSSILNDDVDLGHKLFAINCLRTGYISEAYFWLYPETDKMPDDIIRYRAIEPFDINRDQFFSDMDRLLAYLKEKNV